MSIIQQHILIEAAGVAWIAAECAILLLLRGARRHMRLSPLPRSFHWPVIDRRAVIAFTVALAALAVYAPGRHFIGDSFAERVAHAGETAAVTTQNIERIYQSQTRPHLIVWSSFILTWVVLEIAIVWNGARLYYAVREVLDAP